MRGDFQLGTQLMRHPHTHQRGLAILWSTPCAFATSSMSFLLLPHPENEKTTKVDFGQRQSNRLHPVLIMVNYNHNCTEPNQNNGPRRTNARSMPCVRSLPGNLPNLTMTYLDLVSSHIEKNGGSPELIAAVRDYLKNAHPHDEPPWSQEYDEICQRAVAFANSKAERLRKHKKRVAAAKAKPAEMNGRHRQSLAQERHAIRQALRQPNSVSAHRSMLARLEELEKLIINSKRNR
jgi:hypothetical protein